MLIVLVCTGNTCRSPMAEVLAKNLIAKELNCDESQLEDAGVMVMSAGIAAMPGSRPSPEAVEVMSDAGLVLDGHVAQPLSERLARHADIILTMTNGHRQAIVSQWPDIAPRVQVLRTDDRDISDPIGGSLEVYRECAQQIETHLAERVQQMEFGPNNSQ